MHLFMMFMYITSIDMSVCTECMHSLLSGYVEGSCICRYRVRYVFKLEKKLVSLVHNFKKGVVGMNSSVPNNL